MLDYKLEHLFTYTGLPPVRPPEVVGNLPEGLFVNFYPDGGDLTGPNLKGKVRPAGGDSVIIRKDGVALLDVRTTLQTHDGALILINYPGIIDLGADGYDKFLKGQLPPVARIRTSVHLVTSAPNYAWVNRLHCLGIGEFRATTQDSNYDVYAVR
jgi:hypothetical protein